MVVPDGHDKDHTLIERLAHGRETAKFLERVGVAECGLLHVAEVVGNGVERVHARDGRLRVGDDLAVLDVEATNLGERAGGGVVRAHELGDDSELGGSVDRQARPEEGMVAHAPRVEVAPILVTDAIVTVVAFTTIGALAASLALDVADVGGHSRTVGVGFPDVHLVTAGPILTGTRVGIIRGAGPVEDVCLGRMNGVQSM